MTTRPSNPTARYPHIMDSPSPPEPVLKQRRSRKKGDAQPKKSVCVECRRLKLKCDRGVPCESCIRRGMQALCPHGALVSAGRGKRSVMSGAPMLTDFIAKMGDRIHELEQAIEELGTPRDVLLSHRAAARPRPPAKEEDIDPLVQKLGVLSVNPDGDAVYFGVTAGPEALLSMEGCAQNALDSGSSSSSGSSTSTRSSHSSPATSISSFSDPCTVLEGLRSRLPARSRAYELCHLYFNNAGWPALPLTQDEALELLALVYGDLPTPSPPSSSTSHSTTPVARLTNHHFASAYFIFTLGALMDLALPAFNAEADRFFNAGNEAMGTTYDSRSTSDTVERDVPMSIPSPGGSFDNPPTIQLVRALTILSIIYGHGGQHFSLERSWAVVSTADAAAKVLGLHRASTYKNMDPRQAYRCKALFWDMYSLETVLCVSLGRPPNTLSTDINFSAPDDSPFEGHPFMKIQPGYRKARGAYTTEVMAPILEALLPTTAGGKPSYDEALEVDRRIRQYVASAPFRTFPRPDVPRSKAAAGEGFAACMQRHLIPIFSSIMLMFLHNAYFVDLIQEAPDDPQQSALAPSFLAAYRGAGEAIGAMAQLLNEYPEMFSRWWILWKSLFNAAVVVGTVAANYPHLALVSCSKRALFTAIKMLEFGARTSDRAASGLPVLRRLAAKVLAVHAQMSRPPADCNSRVSTPSERAEPRPQISPDSQLCHQLKIFAGDTSVVAKNSTAVARSSSVSTRNTHPDVQRVTESAAAPPPTYEGEGPEAGMPNEEDIDVDAWMAFYQNAAAAAAPGQNAADYMHLPVPLPPNVYSLLPESQYDLNGQQPPALDLDMYSPADWQLHTQVYVPSVLALDHEAYMFAQNQSQAQAQAQDVGALYYSSN
ncbi:Zn(2)-C6 fungal-type domain-containing protein [Mycena kentingensis (nom. inval.)]|nr:Zn(2)-C6 fungal-type domain-containing protein [Mycena kentingensis (nom. inval.)]